MKPARWSASFVALVSVLATFLVATSSPSGAAIYPGDGGAVYKEYWVPHATWTGGCVEHGLFVPANGWFLEPGPCTKTITFNIPDDVSRVAKVEIYLDLWRNYTGINAARYKLNNGPVRQPAVGYDWSRTPWVQQIPVGELKKGANTLVFTTPGPRYHVHDVAFRVYHDATHPLVAGPGSDVTPPTVALTNVAASNGTFPAAGGGTLQVSNDQVILAATATGAEKVEFHAYFDGYDTDNDGQARDWHAFNRNNWNPGGAKTRGTKYPTGATLGTAGIDLNDPYSVTWRMPHVINQSGVKFKARAVDTSGNVRETAASGSFTLARSFNTSKHLIPGFVDFPLHSDGRFPQTRTVTINLPSLAGVQSAYLVGHFWQNPFISVNGNARFLAFPSTEDAWDTSIRSVPVNHLRAGANTITYTYNPDQIRYGQFIERPGPMVVLRGGTGGGGGGGMSISQHPANVTVPEGQTATFSVVASSTRGPVTFQWTRNGTPIPGATTAGYTTAPVTAGDNGARFAVNVSDGTDSTTSNAATLTVGTPPPGGRSLSVSDPTVTEGTGSNVTLTFVVSLSQTATTATSVTVSTTGGSATAGADYQSRTTTVTIPAGRRTVAFGVPVIGDSLAEGAETVEVTLTNPVGATIADGAGVGTITDND